MLEEVRNVFGRGKHHRQFGMVDAEGEDMGLVRDEQNVRKLAHIYATVPESSARPYKCSKSCSYSPTASSPRVSYRGTLTLPYA